MAIRSVRLRSPHSLVNALPNSTSRALRILHHRRSVHPEAVSLFVFIRMPVEADSVSMVYNCFTGRSNVTRLDRDRWTRPVCSDRFTRYDSRTTGEISATVFVGSPQKTTIVFDYPAPPPVKVCFWVHGSMKTRTFAVSILPMYVKFTRELLMDGNKVIKSIQTFN